jgi:hypothetical protein
VVLVVRVVVHQEAIPRQVWELLIKDSLEPMVLVVLHLTPVPLVVVVVLVVLVFHLWTGILLELVVMAFLLRSQVVQ